MLGGLRRLFGGSSNGSENLEQALLVITEEVWEVTEKTRGQHYPSVEHGIGGEATRADTEQRLEESFRRLLARWPEAELTRLVAEMFFDSQPWYRRYAWDYRRPEETRWLLPGQGRLILHMLRRWLAAHPPADLVARLRRRFDELLADPYAAPPVPFPDDYTYPPTMADCLQILQGLEGDEATVLIRDLVNRAATEAMPVGRGRPKGFAAFATTFGRALPWLLERLWRAGLFEASMVEGVLRRFPIALAQASSGPVMAGHPNVFHRDLDPRFATLVRGLVDDMVRRWAENLDEETAHLFERLGHLEGSYFLIKACQYIERLRLKSLPTETWGHGPGLAGAVARMCRVVRISEDEEQVVTALRSFKQETLLLVLPLALQYQSLICRALDWDGAEDLVRLVQRAAGFEEDQVNYGEDVRNSPDPTNGVLDRNEVLALHARLGKARFDAILKAFAAQKTGTKNAIFLVQTALGGNEKKVLEGFAKRNQRAVKALGLMPIEHPDEVLRRYLALRQFAKEAAQFGLARQTTERAAAAAGLTNLALNAGYADATRLEWAMEARLGSEAGLGREVTIDEQYTLRLEGVDGKPEVVAYKDGKALRSLPAPVKKHPEYAAMRETKAQLRAQASRYRRALEEVMCRGEALTPAEVQLLGRNPVAAPMLAALLFLDGAGRVGLYRHEEQSIEDLAGARHPLEGPLRVAHCYDLYRLDLLAGWQRELVRRRVVQPFKQAFRELYLITPAETETRTYSNRFAGQTVDAKQAARLLQAQGWDCTGEEFPRKTFPGEGLTAFLTFTEYYHFMGEVDSLVIDRVCFVPAKGGHWWGNDEHRLPLAEVPPLVFSEVMRDVDLVASVAQYVPAPADGVAAAPGAACTPSREVVERRADLVRSLAEDLGLRNVRVEGHHALVRGKLADYRVHLGSATIHIEPGAYLCVVPAGWGTKHNRLFLPFDAEDLKTSEVVSKVLLLAEDDKITDKSILNQIRSKRD